MTSDVIAPLGRRLLALVYEVLLIAALLLVAGGSFQLLAGFAGVPATAISSRPLLSNLLFVWLLAVLFAYYGFSWTRSGQSLPMRTWKLRLQRQDGGLLTWRQAARRALYLLAFTLPLAPAWATSRHGGPAWLLYVGIGWALLPWLWALLDRERQFLHDRLSRCRIVRL